MKWGTFSLPHILTMLLAAGILLGLYFLLRNKSQKTQTAVLGSLSFLGIAAILYELLTKTPTVANLPLHLCSLNAMLLPIVVFTRNKTMGNLLLLWCLGALAALVLNYDMTEQPLFSWNVFFYYFPHVMEFGIPLLLVALKLVKKDAKCILTTLGISLVVYTAVHFLNILITRYCVTAGIDYTANYMFSMRPNNPLTELFFTWIPHTYWYMYLVLLVAGVYLLILYTPEILRYVKGKKKSSANVAIKS